MKDRRSQEATAHADSSTARGFFALPANGQGSSVLVLHPWWGLNDSVRAFCTRLADAGFVVCAPDLYHGTVVNTIADAETISSALFQKRDQARAEVAAAAAFLKRHADQPNAGVAVVGFSMGAAYALDLSTTAEYIRSVVIFYGSGGGDFSQSQAAYLGHFAANDDFEPQTEVAALAAAIKAAGRPVQFYTYPNVGHWFFEPDVTQAFNQEAAELAWERTLAFLRQAAPPSATA